MRVPPGKGEEWLAVMLLVHGRLLFSFIVAVHTFPIVLQIESSHPNLWKIAIGFNLTAFVFFMWLAGCFPAPGVRLRRFRFGALARAPLFLPSQLKHGRFILSAPRLRDATTSRFQRPVVCVAVPDLVRVRFCLSRTLHIHIMHARTSDARARAFVTAASGLLVQ